MADEGTRYEWARAYTAAVDFALIPPVDQSELDRIHEYFEAKDPRNIAKVKSEVPE